MKLTNVEDVYPLSPMQEGMLFHTLYAPGSGVYFEQLTVTLHGTLHSSALQQAWQQVVDRHAVFRTEFYWENLKKPLQMVRRDVTLPWQGVDWQGWSAHEQDEQLALFLQADREKGFSFSEAPLMRCTLIKLSASSYHFVWSHHHLLCDGWCVPLILQEVFALYDASIEGRRLELRRLRPYRDYIAWLQKQDLADAERFWRQKLQPFTAPTRLVVDKPAHQAELWGDSYNNYYVNFSEEHTARLITTARQHHLTLNTLVQGAWALLLSRYNGADGEHVLFGMTVSGRPPALSGVESMMGLFINTLPVPIAVPQDAQLSSWLQGLQRQQVELEQYSYSPLVDIQGWSEVPRGMPLFDSLIVFENYPEDDALGSPGNLQIQLADSFEQTNYPLTISVIPERELTIILSYDTSRFEQRAIERMAGHFRTLLAGIGTALQDQPNQLVNRLPLLTTIEAHQLLVESNDTFFDYGASRDACIHHLFEQQVEQTPDAIAVILPTSDHQRRRKADFIQQLTYGELNARANQLAHALQQLGVGAEDVVGLCVGRGIEMVIGVLAILKAGGAYLPLDPDYPLDRLAFILSDAQPKVLLTERQVAKSLDSSLLNELSVPQLYLDGAYPEASPHGVPPGPAAGASPSGGDASVPPLALGGVRGGLVTADNLAYLIYTSGSTGRPKGVLVEHRSIATHCRDIARAYQIEATDRVLQFASLNFDPSIDQILATLITGASLVIRDHSWTAREFSLKMEDYQFNIFEIPPAYAQLLFSEWVQSPQLLMKQPPKVVNLGGDLFSPELVKLWRQLPLRDSRLLNTYGPTEASITATVFDVTEDFDASAARVPIGQPTDNKTTYILDDLNRAVPIGVPGELHIGGVCVARGYLNRADLSAEKFIANPFGEGRLYKTGDLCRYLPDSQRTGSGCIEFLGRVDNQVKVRGVRIELGEIEALLDAHPQVRESVVVVQEDEAGAAGKYLAAYLVLSQAQMSAEHSMWRSYLAETLPDYMIPNAFVRLEALPLTPNGKVDRRALPKPDRTQLQSAYVAPSSATEAQVAAIWRDVLELSQVGMNDNFFELGGHSLLATQVVSQIRKLFHMELPIRSLFEYATVASLAEHIELLQAAQDVLASDDEIYEEEGEL